MAVLMNAASCICSLSMMLWDYMTVSMYELNWFQAASQRKCIIMQLRFAHSLINFSKISNVVS